jgi:hypothetical protein|tara:strand:+ start:1583 stop:1942 length:360 start_codon:yes stop_codon:yes gene_type:complete
MAHSIEWLTSEVAAYERYKRLAGDDEVAAFNSIDRHQCVIHVELNGNCENPKRFQEIDADGIGHALILLRRWLMFHGAVSAALRKVNSVGGLGSPDIYDWSDFADEDESIWWDLVEDEQ